MGKKDKKDKRPSSPRDKKGKKQAKRDAKKDLRLDDPETETSTGKDGAQVGVETNRFDKDDELEYAKQTEPNVAITIDQDDIDEVEPLLLFENHIMLTDSDSDTEDSASSADSGNLESDGFHLSKHAQTFEEKEFGNGFSELKPNKAGNNSLGAVKASKAQTLRCEIKLTCGGFKVMSMSIVQGLLAGVEFLQFLQFVFLQSDIAFLHLTAAPVYLMRFLFFILYTIVCINVSESLIARSKERPDYQNPLQKTGPCTNFFLVIFNFGALLLTVANADFENFLFNSVMDCGEEICFADGVGDFNNDVDVDIAVDQCDAVVASCSSTILYQILQDHYYAFQAWKIGRLIRIVMAVMSFALWSLVKEQQTHDLEDHMKLMGTVIDAKVAKIREFKQMYDDLAGNNKIHLSISELEALQSRQTGLLEQTTELLNLKKQQLVS